MPYNLIIVLSSSESHLVIGLEGQPPLSPAAVFCYTALFVSLSTPSAGPTSHINNGYVASHMPWPYQWTIDCQLQVSQYSESAYLQTSLAATCLHPLDKRLQMLSKFTLNSLARYRGLMRYHAKDSSMSLTTAPCRANAATVYRTSSHIAKGPQTITVVPAPPTSPNSSSKICRTFMRDPTVI